MATAKPTGPQNPAQPAPTPATATSQTTGTPKPQVFTDYASI